MYEFNFDEWAALYRENPEEFERKRKQVIEAEILKAPVEHRAQLRILQMDCDGIRQAMPPLEATVEMSKLMINKLNELKAPLTQLREIYEDINEL